MVSPDAPDHGEGRWPGRCYKSALPAVTEFASPRAWAFTMLGIHEYLRRFPRDRGVQSVRDELAGRLMELAPTADASDWTWFEDSLSYCNAVLPHALICAGQDLGQAEP